MGDNALLVPVNVCDGGTAYIDQGAGETASGQHNDQEPSRLTSISDMLPLDSSFSVAGSNVSSVDFVAVVNHNLDRQRGSYWRTWASSWVAGAYSTSAYLEELYPTSLDASSNLTGTYTDVDDNPWASSADYLEAAAAGSYSARFGFATPAAALSDVGNDHVFVVTAASTSLPAGSHTLTVKLYDSNTEIATLINATAVGDTDTLGRSIFIAPFSTSQLNNGTGAGVQCEVTATNGLKVYSVLWVVGVTAGTYDSGWVEVDAPPSSSSFGGISAAASGEEPMPIEFHRFSTAKTYTGTARPKITASFLNASNAISKTNQLGVLVAGKAYELEFNPATAELYFEDRSPVAETPGGQNLGSNLRRRRVFRVPLQYVKPADHVEIAERIDWRKGQTGAFYVNVFPNDATLKRLWGAWVRVAEAGAWIPHSEQGGFFFDRSYLLREKL